ncbi:MAG: DUF4911 domain-containing protein [Deltaproteobacteria bacterium]|nr:MAG: DUF4911 domain-containing protein [Deltaproteobacteria bacterium]
MNSMRSDLWLYRINPYEIHYLKFILEGYEGLATLTTLEPNRGLVQLSVPPGSHGPLKDLMEALAKELELHRVTADDESGDHHHTPRPEQIAYE